MSSPNNKDKRVLYALVSRGETVLAEFTSPGLSGNFATLTRVLLTKISPDQDKVSYVHEKYLFHAQVVKKITFLCMADEACGRIAPFEFIGNVQQKFFSKFL